LSVASQKEISDFLFKFKFFAQIPGSFSFIETEKNMRDLAELGLTVTHALNTILQLTYTHYSSGPEDDRDYPGKKVWIFRDDIDGEEIYIKLSNDLNHNIAKCISFHKSKHRLIYPYKK
jgi:hypothetical protein